MHSRSIRLPLYVLGVAGAFYGSTAHAQSQTTGGDVKADPSSATTTAQAAPPPAPLPPPPPPASPAPPADLQPATNSDRSAELTAPVNLATREEAPPAAVNPWFIRPSCVVTAGKPGYQWKLTIYGFAEFDVMNDSTRSFADGMNSNVIAHDGTQAGNLGRTQATIRNTRFGFKVAAPTIGGVKGTGVVEGDFFGYDPNPPTTSEAGFFNNPTFRIRHAYVKAESDVVDVLGGQTYHLLGWQNYFFPASLAFLGLPNMLFGRTGQLRVGHTFKSDAVNVDVAVAGLRPIQRDSSVPDGEAGLKIAFNNWKGISTPGNGGTAAFPAAIGVSGLVRRFKVDQFAAKPVGSSTDTGWAFAADALIPIIPAQDSTDRGNALTLIGEFTVGSADAEQFTGMSAGASFPALPGGAAFAADVDNGLVTYDPSGNGVLHTIDWRTFEIGIQYHLPPTGRALLAVNYTQGDSDNAASLFPKAAGVFQKSQYADFNLFFDVTPSIRTGLGYQYLKQTFCDNTTAQNQRYEALALFFF